MFSARNTLSRTTTISGHAADVEPAGHERDRDHHEQDQIGGSGLDANRGQEEDAEPDGDVVAGEGERERAEEPDPEGEDQRQREWMLRESDSGGDCEQEQPGGACEPARAARAQTRWGRALRLNARCSPLLYAPRHAGRDPASTSPAGDHPGRGRRRPVLRGRAPPGARRALRRRARRLRGGPAPRGGGAGGSAFRPASARPAADQSGARSRRPGRADRSPPTGAASASCTRAARRRESSAVSPPWQPACRSASSPSTAGPSPRTPAWLPACTACRTG